MKKLLLLLILSFFSAQGLAGECPDGSEPTKTVSADGSYFEYKCNAEEKLLRDSRNTWYQPGSYPESMHQFMFDMHEIKGARNFYQFESDLRKDNDVLDEFKNNDTTGIISYLLFEDNKIVIDESDMPRKIINGMLPSNSVGKSLVSYVTGHAICEGYISSVDEALDWDLLDNTLYEDQSLIDILNMTAGDQHYIGETISPMVDNMWKTSGVNLNMTSLEIIAEANLQNTTAAEPVYNYSALTTHVLMNYVIYKTGDDWKKLLHKVFNENAKVKNSVYFELTQKASYGHEPTVRYSFYADRYDFLRIAKAIMEDWNNDTCVGKYLKTIYDRRIDKNDNDDPHDYRDISTASKRYGGQFYFDFVGLEKREIIGLSGFAGQNILIDTDEEKIVVVNSKYRNYDWKEIVYERIKNVQPHSGPTKKIEETAIVLTSDDDPTVSKVIEVTNGDKFIVDIAEPHELAGSNIKVQLKDIDAPDATKSCPAQIKLGTEVKDFVAQKLENASSIKLTNFRKTNTKIIAQVVVDGIDLGDELVSKGYASEEYGYWKPYFCSALSATNQADQYRRDNDEKKAIFWYERSIVLDPDGSSNSRSLFRLYQMYSNFGNTDKSLENLKKSASLGWVPAMEELGSAYLNGSGVKKDSNQGKKWLKKAFDKGSQRAEDIYCASLPKAKQKTCKF